MGWWNILARRYKQDNTTHPDIQELNDCFDNIAKNLAYVLLAEDAPTDHYKDAQRYIAFYSNKAIATLKLNPIKLNDNDRKILAKKNIKDYILHIKQTANVKIITREHHTALKDALINHILPDVEKFSNFNAKKVAKKLN